MQITNVTMLYVQTPCTARQWFLYRVMSYYNMLFSEITSYFRAINPLQEDLFETGSIRQDSLFWYPFVSLFLPLFPANRVNTSNNKILVSIFSAFQGYQFGGFSYIDPDALKISFFQGIQRVLDFIFNPI